jgi:uncharacterized repeat protein (TIGR03803 family)
VFELTSGTETLLHSFSGPDGSQPEAGLVADAAGNLYGTTVGGGAVAGPCPSGFSLGCGTVFKVTSAGAESVLYSFTGGSDGANPYAGLIADAAGNLYGTTVNGGTGPCNLGAGCGTVFKVAPTGAKTVLHNFAGYPSDGESPSAGLIADVAGNLYGTTAYSGGSRPPIPE